MSAARPSVRLKRRSARRADSAHPWIFTGEVELDASARAIPPGSVVDVFDAWGRGVATACFHPSAPIALRALDSQPGTVVDSAFLARRLERALALRQRLFPDPCYRLVHADGDGLPGVIIDRYGDALVLQLETAGAEALRAPLLEALNELLAPGILLLRGDSPARQLEGLPRIVELLRGAPDGPITLRENGASYLADLAGGQKTGWFYDQRPNRAFAAGLCRDARVLDLFCYTGGFAIQAALGGAAHVLAVDRSAAALELAAEAAQRNGAQLTVQRGEAFATLEALAAEERLFEVVICDPPAFVPSKRQLAQGAKAYRKLAQGAAGLVAARGFLLAASCSHHMKRERFLKEVSKGVVAAGRRCRLLQRSGAGPDHPVHPQLPQTDYLDALVLQLD